jgi:diguanylate cyclase (GGDEF)-like protein
MSPLADRLAELTGFRDRDVLDVTLVGALRDLLAPQSVSIHRCVGEPGNERWLTRARLAHEDVAATSDPAWTELEQLPALDAQPMRRDCLRLQEIVDVPQSDAHQTLFPLTSDREAVGVLEVETAAPMNAEDRRLVCSILRIYRNFQGLLDYSERDTLTGLLNRKTFDEAFLKSSSPLPQLADHTGRRGQPTAHRHWLGVIDIDHFKLVNDNFGHLIGDEVLLLLSRLMRSSFRFHDRLYRFGGEEFVVLMRCGSEGDAAHAFERLRVATERYVFPQVGHITVSIGFTEVKAGDTPNGAFERADRAVYYAKTHGRNQLRSHGALVASGELEDQSMKSDVELF